MAYFSKFPSLVYDLKVPSGEKFAEPKIVTDIFRRVAIKQNLKEVGSLFVSYSVKDEDTPDIIAHKLYGSAGLHWVVLLANEIINPFFDWPLSERKLVPFIDKKYRGSTFFMEPTIISGDFREGFSVTNVAATATGIVTSVDRTLSSLVVNDILGVFQQGDTLVQEEGQIVPVTAELTRLVQETKSALNHFEDALGNPLNPLTYRDGYIQGGFGFPPTVNVVTNEGDERNMNEAKRQINLIDPDQLDPVLRDLEIIFRRNPRRST